jgi:hypothetical protein
MASLESLKDPLQRLGVLGTAGSQSSSFRRSEVNNSDIWDVTKQYYLNDMVFSAIDGGAYVMEGGATAGSAAPVTAILGGDDPAIDWSANVPAIWVPMATYGPRVVVPAGAQSATVVAGGAITFANCDLAQAAVGANVALGDTNFTAHVQFQITWSAPATAAEWFNLTLTPSGGTPVAAQLVTVVPAAGVAQQNVSVSVYVPLAGDGTTTSIVLTGTVNAASVLTATVAAVSVTYVPLVP